MSDLVVEENNENTVVLDDSGNSNDTKGSDNSNNDNKINELLSFGKDIDDAIDEINQQEMRTKKKKKVSSKKKVSGKKSVLPSSPLQAGPSRNMNNNSPINNKNFKNVQE